MAMHPANITRAQYIPGSGEDAALKTRDTVEPPRMYRVLMHNDNYTTMEFVIEVLMSIYNKGLDEAQRIMLAVHHEDVGLCGVYTKDIAETKVGETHSLARDAGFPLRCSTEPEP